MRDVIHSGQPTRMYSDVIYSFAIGFVGAILFLLVDKHEPDGPMARLLKFLILFVSWRGDLAQVAALRFCAVLVLNYA
jgi:hypothetical protein